jgi:putative drug exporter of the RND superfamily
VFVDAFLVRMTLVPAVLVLLGRSAWWLPGWLDRALPTVDVEGAALHRKVAFQRWEENHGETALLARDLLVRDGSEPVQLSVAPGHVVQVGVADPAERRDVGLALVGRGQPEDGELVVAGLLLPEQRGLVQQATTMLEVDPEAPVVGDVEGSVEDRARLVSASARHRTAYASAARDVLEDLAAAGPAGAPASYVVDAALAVAGGVQVVVLLLDDDLVADDVDWLSSALAGYGVTTVVLAARGRAPSSAPSDTEAGREQELETVREVRP